jgi:hypothetical protein
VNAPSFVLITVLCLWTSPPGQGQITVVQPTYEITYPAPTVDGNSPAFWEDGRMKVYTSTGFPVSMSGNSLFDLWMDDDPAVTPDSHYPLWIEAVWRDQDGRVYGWYHHEPPGLCGGKLSAPQIGAVVSSDGGRTFQDLGIVLASGDPINCSARNGYFAGGHGDFSVILDQERRYFYFLFTNYGGPPEQQGVALARMEFEGRERPMGRVTKLYQGSWNEPGVGGAMTPVLPARTAWERSDTDSFWGPAVHWNTYLQRYVVVLNRSCCSANWPQEGIYISFVTDLADVSGWSAPARILSARDIGFAPGYYPQVFGTRPGETDSLAGQSARLFVKGVSKWQISFYLPEPDSPAPVELPQDR